MANLQKLTDEQVYQTMDREIVIGDRVMVYDHKIDSFREGVVLKRYGYISKLIEKMYGKEAAQYPDCIDVRFNEGDISRGHFTNGVKLIN